MIPTMTATATTSTIGQPAVSDGSAAVGVGPVSRMKVPPLPSAHAPMTTAPMVAIISAAAAAATRNGCRARTSHRWSCVDTRAPAITSSASIRSTVESKYCRSCDSTSGIDGHLQHGPQPAEASLGVGADG